MHVIAISKVKLDYKALAIAMVNGKHPIFRFFHLKLRHSRLHHLSALPCRALDHLNRFIVAMESIPRRCMHRSHFSRNEQVSKYADYLSTLLPPNSDLNVPTPSRILTIKLTLPSYRLHSKSYQAPHSQAPCKDCRAHHCSLYIQPQPRPPGPR